MTHTIVTRVAIGVCALCIGAAVLFASVASTSSTTQAENAATSAASKAQPHPGEALFDSHCAGCHALAEADGMLTARGRDLDANTKGMIEFLKSHGSASDEQDRQIVEFLRRRVK